MASTSTTVFLSSSSTLIDGKAPRQQAATSPHNVAIPSFSPPPLAPQSYPQGRDTWKATAYSNQVWGCFFAHARAHIVADGRQSMSLGRKIARNVMAMAAGESSIMATATGEPTVEISAPELPEIVKTIQEAWDKVDDKYAVTSLALAGAVALWGTAGVISAIDRLPLVPGALEVVGIGYTGWFAYKNLVFKPDREALIKKIKDTYNDIIGSS